MRSAFGMALVLAALALAWILHAVVVVRPRPGDSRAVPAMQSEMPTPAASTDELTGTLPPRPLLPTVPDSDDQPLVFPEPNEKPATPEEIRKTRELKDWDACYAALKNVHLRAYQRTEIIVDRIQQECGFGSEDRKVLEDTLLEEDIEITRRAAEAHIDEKELVRTLALLAEKTKQMNKIREIRSAVRPEFDPRYLQHFDAAAMRLINEHLRGDIMLFEANYGPEGHTFVIHSCGK